MSLAALREHSNTPPRLIGRDQELRKLLALWNRAKAGEGQVALIYGEAGIGKSHPCESFVSISGPKSDPSLDVPPAAADMSTLTKARVRRPLIIVACLADLVASEIISRRDGYLELQYIFEHAFIRDAVYATLSRDRRKELHGRIARALQSKFPSMVETQPELLAFHLENAGLIASAIDYLRKAGQRAIEQSANDEAIKRYCGIAHHWF